MKIIIETIPHAQQRYDTCGDWQVKQRIIRVFDELHISVSEMSNPDYEFLVGLHEMIEAYLFIRRSGVQHQVDAFDLNFNGEGEPGDDINCPYRREHFFATNLEALLAGELGVNFQQYEKAIDKLSEEKNNVTKTTS